MRNMGTQFSEQEKTPAAPLRLVEAPLSGTQLLAQAADNLRGLHDRGLLTDREYAATLYECVPNRKVWCERTRA